VPRLARDRRRKQLDRLELLDPKRQVARITPKADKGVSLADSLAGVRKTPCELGKQRGSLILLKDVTAERLFEGVRVVASGDALLAPGVTRRLISEFARIRPAAAGAGAGLGAAAAALRTLTPRETEVLRLAAAGLSNAEIAARLVVTEDTVKTHVSRLLGKLGLRDRTQAVVTAYEVGLVVPARER
jgi:DNA-binding NarL/FixJ family response regulator